MRILNLKTKRTRGQALIETALVIVLFVILIIGWIGEAVHIVAQVEITNALDLATISAAQAPLGDSADAQTYFDNSFFYTISKNPLISASIGVDTGGYMIPPCTTSEYLANSCSPTPCSGSYLNGAQSASPVITCGSTGAGANPSQEIVVSIQYPKTVLALVYPVNVNLPLISDTVYPSEYRTCGGISCT